MLYQDLSMHKEVVMGKLELSLENRFSLAVNHVFFFFFLAIQTLIHSSQLLHLYAIKIKQAMGLLT